ncbi:hypothetical protein T07_6396 [Trichinella nelsoni]|uniref:Uncharacterized protein n=1 Tax=Trichinella nelsoni TaxID=6336 RepID=A0A0V0RNP1_9BILA|nr:hypothetical protein T07_6396 [Trichinella nelsoni]
MVQPFLRSVARQAGHEVDVSDSLLIFDHQNSVPEARTLWLTGASSSASLRHLLQLPVQLLSGVINEADALRRNCQATSNASVKLNGLGGASLNIWRL